MLDPQNQDSSIFQGASADYGAKSSEGILWEHCLYRGEGDNPDPFQKKSSLFGVSHVNPWSACLPIS